ncbi:2-dehydropantoate 2-reductase [Devosia neptuniae]|jgi:2-dehydropantoate 2-reductase|uniref:2-dehydropantoate 2-reductase n=1 Tax=Devosia TaxID=46913 RepID=UPI0022B00227|nr:2-dehydropantoate 2-reductase [Devosia neptuniae]MCZ4347204.1 2-dehydropantoate 2-reductase [Devosia neptuniae]|tara:strand:- start:11334 stop:12218 length:885 start_codon:yes stop_codon:yes gene_type:complete
MTKIAIIGPGALGGTIAGWLCQNAAHEVIVCARTPLVDLRVETPVGTLNAAPQVLIDPALAQPVDWVLVLTKTYDVAAAKVWLDALVGPGTRVAVLQNGVEHVSRFAALLPGQAIVPAVVDIPASRSAPGRMIQQRLGSIVVPEGDDGADFVALFGETKIDVSAVADWNSRAWGKLCLNCAGAVTALTQRSTGPVWNDDLEVLVRGLVSECAAVARAEGAVIPDSLIEGVIEGARNAPEGAGNSMSVDRFAGRQMELDARNGVIVRLGKKHGIATPINTLFVTLLAASGSPWVT